MHGWILDTLGEKIYISELPSLVVIQFEMTRQITELADFWLVATWNSQNDDHAAFQSPNSNQSLKNEDKDAF